MGDRNSEQQLFLAEVDKNIRTGRSKQLEKVFSNYDIRLTEAGKQFYNLESVKKRAGQTKWKVLENLDNYLVEFEANFIKNGGKVIWAEDSESALQAVLSIVKSTGTDLVVKSKSSVTEEIKLREFLTRNKIECVETDLGDFIQQKSGEGSFHFTMPAIHKSVGEIESLLSDSGSADPAKEGVESLVSKVRTIVRNKIASAHIGITGANFLIADTGSVSITENEGNALLTASYPKIHIVIAGIEKLIPALSDLHFFLPLLSSHATGQKLTSVNTILSGPGKPGEADGPGQMFVILLDNGRSQVLSNEEYRESLSCIHCGACLNVCPVFRISGGFAYGSTAMGPIGSVIAPHKLGLSRFRHLSYASTLCGRCTEVCPVKIDIHKLLLYSRRDIVKKGLTGKWEKWIFLFWKRSMLKRDKMNKSNSWKQTLLSTFFKKSWGRNREMPGLAQTSFNQAWRNKFPSLKRK